MPAAVYEQKCVAVSSDASTCTATAWVEVSNFPPALSISDAALIGQEIALLWAFAWVIKQLLRFIRET